MRICVFGAGAVGGYLAAKLARVDGLEVSVVARGAHLDAIRRHGLQLESPEGPAFARFHAATDDPAQLPEQDLVFVTLKAHSQPAVAGQIRRLLGDRGGAVFVSNGIPWWWNYPRQRSAPEAPDPEDGRLWLELGPERALGCVVYSLNESPRPGVVVHRGNNRWIIGEPSDVTTPRLLGAVEVLNRAGLDAQASCDLRMHVWKKLLRNVAISPLCALTRLTVEQVIASPALVQVGRQLASEVVAVAQAKGFDLAPHAEEATRILAQGAGLSGAAGRGTRPSMLQDILAGRPTEVQALLGHLQRFAREENVPTQTLDCINALARGLETSLQLQEEEA